MEYTSHYSVLKKECLDYLTKEQSLDDGTFADLTFGGGGHTCALAKLNPNYKVISFDQDPDALRNGNIRIKAEGLEKQVTLVDSNFVFFKDVVEGLQKERGEELRFDGILVDLGVSSHHFDESTRGFSFRFDGPLDMRMNNRGDDFHTAEYVVNEYSEKDLERILYEFGEENFAKKIVRAILTERKTKRIQTTKELENIVFHAYPPNARHNRLHPATKTFQAVRIEVNKELFVITELITQLVPFLKIGGRICIISFHSLEDRIVKHEFKKIEDGEIPFDVLTKKPVLPTEQEVQENGRSRSAKLRVIERVAQKRSKNKYDKYKQDME